PRSLTDWSGSDSIADEVRSYARAAGEPRLALPAPGPEPQPAMLHRVDDVLLHHVAGNAHGFGDLDMAAAFDLAQQECAATVFGQLAKGALEQLQLLLPAGLFLRA